MISSTVSSVVPSNLHFSVVVLSTEGEPLGFDIVNFQSVFAAEVPPMRPLHIVLVRTAMRR